MVPTFTVTEQQCLRELAHELFALKARGGALIPDGAFMAVYLRRCAYLDPTDDVPDDVPRKDCEIWLRDSRTARRVAEKVEALTAEEGERLLAGFKAMEN